MGVLDGTGLATLWAKCRSAFGAALSVSGTTITLKNKSDTADILSQVTIPDASTGASGAMSAADKTKLDGVATGATKVTVDGTLSTTSGNAVQNKIVTAELNKKAPAASPALTGTPTSPTAAAGTSTTQIATTEFVTSAVATAKAGVAQYQGSLTSNSAITDVDYKKGWYWVVGAAGSYVGEACEVGDMIFCNSDKGGTYSTAHFDVIQTNMQVLTTAEINAILA